MAKKQVIVYPNYHDPIEDRSLFLKPFDEILSSQGLLPLKRITALYFTQIFDSESLEHFKEHGITIEDDKITLAPWRFSRRTADQKSLSRYKGTLELIENIISDSKTQYQNTDRQAYLTKEEIGKEFYNRALTRFTNSFEVTPELNRKLTGQVDSYKNRFVFLIESVTLNHNSTVTFRMGSFIKKMRDHLIESIKSGRSIYSDPEIISLNTRNLLKFESVYATQLYLLIAKNQFFTNTLEIEIEELREYLGFPPDVCTDMRDFSKRLKQIIKDPGLSNSSCAILEQDYKGKKVFWLVAGREGKRITKLSFKFKSNADLKHELLNSPYKFIRHIHDGSLNEAQVVQIIARVSDDIIPEAWINYCVNKAYEYVDKSADNQNRKPKQKGYKGIGPLVWEYIKNQSFRNEYEIHPDMCVVSDDVGISIMKQRDQEIATQATIPLESDQAEPSKGSLKDKATWEYLKGLNIEDSFITYAQQYISADYIQKKLRLSSQGGGKSSVAQQIKKLVLSDFHSTFEQPIKSYARLLGYSANKANFIHAMMDDELKCVLLQFVSEGKLLVPETWKDTFSKRFLRVLESLNEVH